MALTMQRVRAQALAQQRLTDFARADAARLTDAVVAIEDPYAARDLLLEAAPELAAQHADHAGLLAADLYDETRILSAAPGTYSAQLAEVNTQAVIGSTRRIAGNLFQPDIESIVLQGILYRGLSNIFDLAMRRMAADTTIHNAKIEKIRFARVPVGSCCDFCLMLASRGFVYYTQENAGDGRRYHANCRCQVVASWDKTNPTLDGYDPTKLYEQWLATDPDRDALAKSAMRAKYRNPDRVRAQERLRYQAKRGYPNPDGSYASSRSAAQGILRQKGRKNPDAPIAAAGGGGMKPPISRKVGGAMNDRPDYNAPNWWPRSVGDPSDLPRFPGAKWRHVEDHLVGNVGDNQTAFPPSWGHSQIGDAAAQVLRQNAAKYGIAPNELWRNGFDGLAEVEGRRVVTRVWINVDTSQNDTIVGTVHALRGDEVTQRVGNRSVPKPLLPEEE